MNIEANPATFPQAYKTHANFNDRPGDEHRTPSRARHCKSISLGDSVIPTLGDPTMNGKVIVVTGASGALGKVVAEVALARDARVAGVDHAPSQFPATENRIELGSVDLTDAAQAKKAIDAAAAHFGRLDALVNIAG